MDIVVKQKDPKFMLCPNDRGALPWPCDKRGGKELGVHKGSLDISPWSWRIWSLLTSNFTACCFQTSSPKILRGVFLILNISVSSKTFQTIKNFSDNTETFQIIQNLCSPSRNFPNYPETFQIIQKLSRPSRNFPNYMETFQIQKLFRPWGNFQDNQGII